jgi:hypothetical protein
VSHRPPSGAIRSIEEAFGLPIVRFEGTTPSGTVAYHDAFDTNARTAAKKSLT